MIHNTFHTITGFSGILFPGDEAEAERWNPLSRRATYRNKQKTGGSLVRARGT